MVYQLRWIPKSRPPNAILTWLPIIIISSFLLPPDIKYAMILLSILTPGRQFLLYNLVYHQEKPTEIVTTMLLLNAGALLNSEFSITFVKKKKYPLGPSRKLVR